MVQSESPCALPKWSNNYLFIYVGLNPYTGSVTFIRVLTALLVVIELVMVLPLLSQLPESGPLNNSN